MVKKRFISNLNPNRTGLRKILGDLEADIMDAIWQRKQATVREVHDCLREQREIAYTTVMTVMVRLADKKLLSRDKEGNAFIYTPVLDRKEFTRRAVSEIIDGLMDGFAEPTMAHLIERMSQVDKAKLGELAEIIDQHKRMEKDGKTDDSD